MKPASIEFQNNRNIRLYDVGIRAKMFRENTLRISQNQLARELKCSQTYLHMFEQGKCDSAYILISYMERGFVV